MIRLFRTVPTNTGAFTSCLSLRVEEIGLMSDIFNYPPAIMTNVLYSQIQGMYAGWQIMTVENLEGKVVLTGV